LPGTPPTIDLKLLSAYPRFVAKMAKTKAESTEDDTQPMPAASHEDQTPTEQIEEAYQILNQTLASELLDLMAKMDPASSSNWWSICSSPWAMVARREEAAQVTKKSNDEGIDGIISEDRLGLDVIYVQAKRWQSTVGRIEIQNFVGALVGKHAQKGVFITTSDFHRNAIEYARSVQHKVILIDGQRLAELMIEYDVGVSTIRTIALKVDSDYFDESGSL